MSKTTTAQVRPVQLHASRAEVKIPTNLNFPNFTSRKEKTFSTDLAKQVLTEFCKEMSYEIETECKVSITRNNDMILLDIIGPDYNISIIHTKGAKQ